MSILQAVSSPVDRMALAGLYAWLLSQDYHQHARETIVAHVAREGVLEGCPELDREDLEGAYRVLEESFEPIPYDHPEWGVFDDDEPLPPGADAPDDRPSAAERAWQRMTHTILPISGGSDEAEPYEPTEQDWQELQDWSDELAARRHSERAQLEATRDWYRRNPLSAFLDSI